MKNRYGVPKVAITERGLKQLMKKAAKDHASISDWAKSVGITPQAVSAFVRKTQGAGLQIPEALGFRPQIVFLPVDEPLISTANPPRRATTRPSSKVDHTKEPVERAYRKPVNDREDTKERLKARKR